MMKKNVTSLFSYFSAYYKISSSQKYFNYSTFRQLPTTPIKQNIFIPSKNINRFASKKDVSRKLQELLNIHTSKANDIFSKDKNFTKVSTEEVEKNYHLCLNHGLTKETLESYPNILADQTLSFKLETLKLLSLNVNTTAPLLLINYIRLKTFVFDEIAEKRINEFAKLFQVEENEVCKWMSTKTFLMSVNLHNVKKCTNMLLASGVTHRAIINDLWVLRYSPSVVEERINLAAQNNIDTIKPWMIRAQLDIFDNYARRRSDNKEILGEKKSLVEYLSEKLECSQDVSKFLISKQPALQKKSLRKMNEMIDFLLQKGFTPIHICRTPKIMLHSVETIKKRLKEIEATDLQLDSLAVLTKSQRQYMHVLDSMKANKSKLKN